MSQRNCFQCHLVGSLGAAPSLGQHAEKALHCVFGRQTCLTAGFGVSDIYLQGNIGEQYLLCYYWMVATLTTNGQIGNMTPNSMLEVSDLAQTCIHFFHLVYTKPVACQHMLSGAKVDRPVRLSWPSLSCMPPCATR